MPVKDLVIEDLKPAIQPVLVGSVVGLSEMVAYCLSKDLFGFDVETNVVQSFYKRKLRTVQVGDKEKQFVIDLLMFAGTEEAMMEQGNYSAPSWATDVAGALALCLASPSCVKVGTSLQFDYETVYWNLGVQAQNLYDCQLAEQVLFAGRVNLFASDFWGMKDMLERYCLLRMTNKGLQTSFDLSTPLTKDQIEYCALDVRLPLSIRAAQLVSLERQGLTETNEIEQSAIMAFGDMHVAGFYLDPKAWMVQVANVNLAHKNNLENLDEEFIKIVGSKDVPQVDNTELEAAWRNEKNKEQRKIYQKTFYTARKKAADWKKAVLKYEGAAAINYGAPQQVLRALQSLGLDLDGTNDKLLEDFADNPSVNALREYRTTKKLLTTYGLTFLDYIDPDTGRVHSNINQIGADSGRTSSSAPNVQNITNGRDAKGKVAYDYHGCFKARPGYKLVIRDYDGCELRILAEAAGEQMWIDAFNRDEDVHSICAELIYGDVWKNAQDKFCAYYIKKAKCKCPEHKVLRDKVKALNFGIPYGLGASGLAGQLKISKSEAQTLIDRHAAEFPAIAAWLKKAANLAKATGESRTACGRRRLFTKPTRALATELAKTRAEEDDRPVTNITQQDISRAEWSLWGSIERFGKNTPIQGGNADMSKAAMAMIWPRTKEFGAVQVNMVHDELVYEVPEENAVAFDAFVGECMEKAGARWVTKMRMTSSGQIANEWHKD